MYSDDRLSEEKLLRDLEPAEEEITRRLSPNRYCRYHAHVCAIQVVFFLISFAILLQALLRPDLGHCDCADYMPMWSPALDAVTDTGHMQRFDGSFATPNSFKGSPAPSIDEAWDNITFASGPLWTT